MPENAERAEANAEIVEIVETATVATAATTTIPGATLAATARSVINVIKLVILQGSARKKRRSAIDAMRVAILPEIVVVQLTIHAAITVTKAVILPGTVLTRAKVTIATAALIPTCVSLATRVDTYHATALNRPSPATIVERWVISVENAQKIKVEINLKTNLKNMNHYIITESLKITFGKKTGNILNACFIK